MLKKIHLHLTLAATLFSSFTAIAEEQKWQALNQGLSAGTISVLSINPNNVNELFAGSSQGGLFKSTNHASSWTALEPALFKNTGVTCIAIHSQHSNEIYIGTTEKGIYKSNDGGATWKTINNGIKISSITALVSHFNLLYAATKEGYFYVSSDKGDTWKERYHTNSTIHAIATNPSNIEEILLTMPNDFIRSFDGGLHWEPAPHRLPITPIKAVYSERQPDYFYLLDEELGLFQAQNSGHYIVRVGPVNNA